MGTGELYGSVFQPRQEGSVDSKVTAVSYRSIYKIE